MSAVGGAGVIAAAGEEQFVGVGAWAFGPGLGVATGDKSADWPAEMRRKDGVLIFCYGVSSETLMLAAAAGDMRQGRKRAMQMSGDVRRIGVGAGLIGGAVAVALTVGLGGAQAGAADQLAGVAAAGGGADSTDLLVIAGANFLDAKDVITGIDTSELSGTLLSAVESAQRIPGILDTLVFMVDDRLAPAESAILAHSGSMSSLIDQLFFAPLNQQWADASESMLNATNAFESAIEDGSVPGAVSASFQMLGITFSESIPAAIASMPIVWIGSLFDDVVTTADLFDFSF
ncbi:MAG: hypothetical protein WBA69_03100 [Mycobacterium sp.]